MQLSQAFAESGKSHYSHKKLFAFFSILDSLEVVTDISDFKTTSTYRSGIGNLINSPNKYQRTIAYRLVGIVDDKRFIDTVANRLMKEDTLPSAWAFMALTKLDPKATSLAMKWLIEFEDLNDAVFLPSFLRMDTASIIKTSYQYYDAPTNKAKILSLSMLSLFDKSSVPDSLARIAIRNWDNKLKGYAIVDMARCNKGNYKAILSPYINIPYLKTTIIDCLRNSPTATDKDFAKSLQ